MEDKYRSYQRSSPSSPFRRPRSPAAFHRSMSASDRDRDREVERITSKYTSSPVGPQTVFLSKKMKELTEKQQQSSSPVPFSSSVRNNYESIKPSYERSTPTKMPASSHNNDEYGKTERTTRSLLDELGNKKIGGNDLSPTDSFIDRMIMSAQLDINSPMDFGISRQSSVISLTKHKDSPFQEYRSLPSSRLLETDAMKSETKYLESRRSPVPMKEYAHDKLLSSAAFENSPLRTYSQSQVGLSPRDRANSFHDIREREEAVARGQSRPRARHQTLPYGVGSTELTAAKFDMDMKNIIRELEDTGFFHQSLAGLRSGPHQPLLPQDPYFSLPLAPPASADMSRRPSSVTLANLGLASPSHAPTTRPGSAMTLGDSAQPLVVMRKQDLDDFLRETKSRCESRVDHNEVSSLSAAQSRCVTPAASARDPGSSWVKKKTNIANQSEVDYKKLALVNDDLLKMWEESQAENTKLRLELSGTRGDLETARNHLSSAEKKVVKNNAVTDQEKREKKIVVKKLAEMEEELKLLALSENLTDQTLDQLKSDNSRLRDENTALLRVIAKMSK